MVVQAADVASFQGKIVHPVCSTFTIAREAEWTTRQFVLEMKEEGEEGVGTFVNVEHKSPAFVGEQILFTGTVRAIHGHELICDFEARVGDRLVATGSTGQKIFQKEKLDLIFKSHQREIKA